MKRIVVYGPPACGKTRNAEALAAHFGVNIVVDDWCPKRHQLVSGALHLSHERYEGQEARSFAFADILFDPARRVSITRQRAPERRTFR
jgi:replication-associated recombination protein RarA